MNFQDRLLTELRTVVAERGTMPTRRTVTKRRVALAAVAAATLAIGLGGAVPLVTDPTAAAAYKVERDGDIVTVSIFARKDAEGLERELEAAGLSAEVDYPPLGKKCREPRYSPDPNPPRYLSSDSTGASFTVRVADTEGKVLVIDMFDASKGDLRGMLTAIGVGWTVGPVAPCELVDADI